jgi:hypothetical protein
MLIRKALQLYLVKVESFSRHQSSILSMIDVPTQQETAGSPFISFDPELVTRGRRV